MSQTFTEIITNVNQYSNLLLIVITAVYVILTWLMVREMRRSREGDHDAVLVAAILPFGDGYTKIQIYNAGVGPALDIVARIDVRPQYETISKFWSTPLLLSLKPVDFLLPDPRATGSLTKLEGLRSYYDEVVIDVEWRNIFGRKHEQKFVYSLAKLAEGWYRSGQLRPKAEFPDQMDRLVTAVSEIRTELRRVAVELGQMKAMLPGTPELEHTESSDTPATDGITE